MERINFISIIACTSLIWLGIIGIVTAYMWGVWWKYVLMVVNFVIIAVNLNNLRMIYRMESWRGDGS